MMAFIVCSEAGLLPLTYSGLSGLPLVSSYSPYVPAISQYASIPESKLIAHEAPVVYHAPTTYIRPTVYDNLGYDTGLYHPTVVAAAPRLIASAPIAYSAIPGEAKYTAINRGALHEAPLPGHALSQTSLNLAPAK